ncbi:hypothetical protein THARTR1_10757 [Trichoderma harzianum]|uniref:Uncharacterized protein n=1 Tax=Trichoderma harzianum TaxID=5544 RepID=A0A2K0TLP2_TRIHA|nr:hypothetical protein THARTR1_10757 [Trichoderma harzianum]
MGNLLEGADSIRKLLSIAQVGEKLVSLHAATDHPQKSNIDSQLTRFLKHAKRFIQSHGSIIERAPLQAYGSALVFSPTTSEVRASQWKHRLPFIEMLAGVKINWDSHRQTLDADDTVNFVAFSPNGRVLASALDEIVQFWEASTGSHQRTLKGHNGKVTSIAFSSESKILASSSNDNTIRLWEVSTGSYQRTLKGHIGRVESIAFSPDDTILASSSNDDTIRLWDIALGNCRQTIKGCDDGTGVRSLAFSPDGRILASASGNGLVRLWDMALGKYQQTIDEIDSVHRVAFSPDGNILATSRVNNSIQLWDTSSWRKLKTLDINVSNGSCLAFSPNGKMLAFIGPQNSILLWDMATESIWDTLVGHRDTITSLAFSPDGMTLASASYDRTIRLWDISSGNRHRTVEEHTMWHSGSSTFMAFSPGGETMVSASRRGFQIWDTATWGCEQTISQKYEGHPYRPIVVFSPDGKTLALALDDGIELWDAATGVRQQRLSVEGHSPEFQLLAFSPNSKTLASSSSGSRGGDIWLCHKDMEGAGRWSNPQKLIRADERCHTLSLGFSPDGAHLLANYRPVRLPSTSASLEQRFDEDPAESFLYFDAGGQEWIMLNGKRILWLPADYRPYSVYPMFNVIVHGNMMAWINQAGGQMFFQVRFTEGMLWQTE